MNYFIIPNDKNLNIYEDNLIIPLDNFSIGFDTYFTIEEIESISKEKEVSIVINKFLHKKDLEKINKIKDKLNNIKYIFIEDLSLINLLNKEKIVLSSSHIITNYESINYFYDLGIKNIVVSNELTKEELLEIKEKTKSNIFYVLIGRNTLMYSKRKLLSSYYEHKSVLGPLLKEIEESVSKKHLIIKEENSGTCIFDKNIFSANYMMSEINTFNFIINLNNMTNEEKEIILKHYKEENLSDYINVENYFTKNKIIYKVGGDK